MCNRTSLGRRRPRRGAIILLVAIAIPVILVLAGFAVDLANMQRTRTELRTATDLAARAAADELSRTGDQSLARIEGKSVAAQNTVAGDGLSLADGDFVFGRSEEQVDGSWTFTAGDTPTNSVRVIGNRTNGSIDGPVGLFFGRVYGRSEFETTFSATATFLDVDICLVLDRSSSMKLAVDDEQTGLPSTDERACQAPWVNSRWVALEQAIGVFTGVLNTTPASEQVAVVTFGDSISAFCLPEEDTSTVSTDVSLTFDLSQVDAAMVNRGNTIWNGATNIEAGVERGIQVLTGPGSRSTADKVMIVLTDGNSTTGDPVPQAVAAQAAGITVHTITFGVAAGQTAMQNVATNGGGQHYHAVDTASLNAVFEQLAAAVAMLTE